MRILLVAPRKCRGNPAISPSLAHHLHRAGHTAEGLNPSLRPLPNLFRNADFTIIEDNLPAALIARLTRLLLRRRYALLLTKFDPEPHNKWPFWPWLLRSIFKGATHTHALNTNTRNALLKLGLRRDTLQLTPPPVTINPPPANANLPIGLVPGTPPAHPHKLLAIIGPNAPKTPAALLRALAITLETQPNLQLTLHAPDDALPEIDRRLQAMGLEANVRLEPSPTDPDLPLPPSHIAIAFCAFDEDPNTQFALTAAAQGLPLIAAMHPLLNDWLKHDETALLTPPGDEHALADTLLRLLQSPTLPQQLATTAQTRLTPKHTWQSFLTHLLPP